MVERMGSTNQYVAGELTPSAEIIFASVILYGKDGSVVRLPPSVRHLRDTTTLGLMGGLGLQDFGPKSSLWYLVKILRFP